MSDDEIVFIDDIGDLSQTPVQQGPPQPKQRLHDLVTLFSGDCLETMRQIGDDCIDAVVTDPPYHLQSIVKRFGSSAAAPPLDYEGGTGVYKRASAGFMGKCYHPATDIMTLNGWKVIADIRVGDTVATLDPQTRSLCWQRVDQTHSYEYNGNLIHVRHRSAEQLVTPNHHVVVDRQQNVEFIEAKDLPRTFHLIAQSTPYPGRSDDVIIYSERQFGYNKGIIKESETYLAKPFFRMFGSWLGDGFVVQRKDDHPANDFFGFSVKKLRKIEAIRHNLTELGIKFTESPGTDNTVFYCYDFVLLGFLKTLGKALTKHIPEWVFEWDASCLEELYRGLIDTDGTRQGDDDQELYFTSSPRLADDFQRLCLQTGRSAISIFKPGGKELVIDGNSCISSDAWTLSVLKPNKRMYCERDARRDRPTIPAVIPVPYHGDVYCIGVPQRHIIYTRFNGKPVWSGNSWDGGDISFQPALWAEVFRILKPGGHILVMGGTRTFHRVVCAIEDAGFEIRDTLMWVYGCLDDQTQVATIDGVKPYHKTIAGDLVLCYDVSSGGYSYQPILEIIEYEFNDTAYRLIGDFGEQVVTRNHRCIVECGGTEEFKFAEEIARERQACVPILESLRELQDAVSYTHKRTGIPEQIVQHGMCGDSNWSEAQGTDDSSRTATRTIASFMRSVWQGVLAKYQVACQGIKADMFTALQRCSLCSGIDTAFAQRPFGLVTGNENNSYRADDWAYQSILERRVDVSKSKGEVRRSTDQVCTLSTRIYNDGSQRWIYDGASSDCGEGNQSSIDESGDSSSYQSQCNKQQINKSNAVSYERRAQSIRAWPGHKTAVVRVVPFHHTGKVWCLRVSTGAFVAVRGGVAFPTGNSGFPKSRNISKDIDKAAGAKRKVVGIAKGKGGENLNQLARVNGNDSDSAKGCGAYGQGAKQVTIDIPVTEPVTPEAIQWDGWGTGLKPAHEMICLARKPLSEKTVAANVLMWGTGALNIDGCRVSGNVDEMRGRSGVAAKGNEIFGSGIRNPTDEIWEPSQDGRWPPNLLHNGSPEVVEVFPDTGISSGGSGEATRNSAPGRSGIYGVFAPMQRANAGGLGDSGSAARFYPTCPYTDEDFETEIPIKQWLLYCAKANKQDRNGSKHPTIKPIKLMQWLCRLITPPGGCVLDPFAGSGTTGVAAVREGFQAILCENDPESQNDIRRRFSTVPTQVDGGDAFITIQEN